MSKQTKKQNTQINVVEQTTEAIIASKQFTANSTVKAIAEHLIVNYPQLTNNQTADVVVNVRVAQGLDCECSGACIAWYKNKMKNKSPEEIKKQKIKELLKTMSLEDLEKLTKYLEDLEKLTK